MSSFPDRQFPHDPVAAGNSNPASWRQVIKRALEQSGWRQTYQPQTEPVEAVKTQSSSPRRRNGLIAFAAIILFLLAAPIVLFIRFTSRHSHPQKQGQSVVARGESLLGMNHATAKPKPSPYKYTLATPITRPSNPIVFTPPPQQNPAPTVTPQIPTQATPVAPALPQTANTMPPPPAATTAKAPFTPIVYPAHHDKHFGGCTGQLTLAAGGLNFHCAEDPGDTIQVALNEIGAVDENGIETLSGRKYHFTISGMSKSAAQQLFAKWLHQVR